MKTSWRKKIFKNVKNGFRVALKSRNPNYSGIQVDLKDFSPGYRPSASPFLREMDGIQGIITLTEF